MAFIDVINACLERILFVEVELNFFRPNSYLISVDIPLAFNIEHMYPNKSKDLIDYRFIDHSLTMIVGNSSSK